MVLIAQDAIAAGKLNQMNARAGSVLGNSHSRRSPIAVRGSSNVCFAPQRGQYSDSWGGLVSAIGDVVDGFQAAGRASANLSDDGGAGFGACNGASPVLRNA